MVNRSVLPLAVLLAVLCLALPSLTGKATAQTFTTLYSFTNGNDGSLPQAALILSGNTLYGTALESGSAAGPAGNGTVFAINTNGSGFTVLHTFTGGGDGDGPFAGLLLSGNTLYGTASQGGNSGYGTVFTINTNGTGFTALYSFSGGSDGAYPKAGLILSGNTLYGTAEYGGTSNWGTVFAVNTNGSGFTVLHTFTGGSDGARPFAALALTGGTIYGTAQTGGSSGYGNSGYGTVFAINTNGSGFTVLHSFTGGGDGAYPQAGLSQSGDTLYSTAPNGGIGSPGGGTVFTVNTNGGGFTVLHSFSSSEGSDPGRGLVLLGTNLFGVAAAGAAGQGMVFAVSTNGTGFTVLRGFTPASDGANPVAALLLSGGTFYGTAEYGGISNAGTVFGLSTALPPIIARQPQSQAVAVGGSATLTVLAAGTPPLSYQWYKDGRMLLGATSSTVTVASAGVTNSGSYSAVVTNAYGMTISLPAFASVGNPGLLAWGSDLDGQLGDGRKGYQTVPEAVLSNVVAVAAGQEHSLLVKNDGTLWAMGYNFDGELGDGSAIDQNLPELISSNVTSVASGFYHSLFVKNDGSLWVMGYNASGQLGNGTTTNRLTPEAVASNVVAVAAGGNHSLFVRSDGTLWGMGKNTSGQLGDGTTTSHLLPVKVASNVVLVAAGNNHSLFVKSDGSLWAMGNNPFGQLGDGTTTNHLVPEKIATNVVAVAAGASHSLFVKGDHTLWAMGQNPYGALGDGTTTNHLIPELIASNVTSVAAGWGHSLFIKSGAGLWGMGFNEYGMLGDGATTNHLVPELIANGVTMAVGGMWHSLFVDNAGVLWAMGLNEYGQLGYGFTGTSVFPELVSSNIVFASAGGDDSLFIKSDGTLWGMGANLSGQLGDTNTNDHLVPGFISSNVVSASAGFEHSLFVKNDGTLWAMGNNYDGQLGDGTTTDHPIPEMIAGNVRFVAAGYYYSLFVTSDGTLWATGYNPYGQLGDGTTANHYVPERIATNVVTVAVGISHSLFVKSDGTLWGMGYDGDGELGDGVATNHLVPELIAASVTSAAAGESHSLFTASDGSLWAMGNDSVGQLGDGGGTNHLVPEIVASGVISVAAGVGHSLFFKNDGTLWAMGLNGSGELGDGTSVERNTPVRILGMSLANAVSGSYAYHSLALGQPLPPVITSQPMNLVLPATSNGTFTVTVAGVMPFAYQWQQHGTNLTDNGHVMGSQTGNLSLQNVQLSDQGNYQVTISSPYGAITSSVAVLTVDVCTPPASGLITWWRGEGNANDMAGLINGTPQNGAGFQPGFVGQAFSFDGVNDYILMPQQIAGHSAFTLQAWILVDPNQPSYGAVVTTRDGDIEYNPATGRFQLDIWADRNGCYNSTPAQRFWYDVPFGLASNQWHHVAFAVSGINFGRFYVDGQQVAIGSRIFDPGVLSKYDTAIGGNTPRLNDYFKGLIDEVVVHGRALAANEVAAIYTAGVAGMCLDTAPGIVTQPQSQIVTLGSNALFTVTAAGTPPLSYQWLFNGTNLAGGTASSLAIPNAQLNNDGSYQAIVTNGFGSATSTVASLNVDLAPLVAASVSPRFGPPPLLVSFSSAGSGDPDGTNITYLWDLGDGNTSTDANPTYTYFSEGNYVVTLTVSDGLASAISSNIVITVRIPPAITAQPQSQTLAATYPVTFSVTAASTPPTSYKWLFNGTNISGATSTSFSNTNIQAGDAGNYSVVVSNAGGSVTSSIAPLVVLGPDTMTSFAGSVGSQGTNDGTGSAAQFRSPSGVTVDGAGNIYVADYLNHTVRQILPDGTVTTIAGNPGQPGSADGTGSAAQFFNPSGVAVDTRGNLYVTDRGNATIRKIAPGGVVTTLAGTPGQTGSADAIGGAAQFLNPSAVAVDVFGNLYVADTGNNTVRKITPAGAVTTLAGTAGQVGSADGTGGAAQFSAPSAVALDSAANVYVADRGNVTIRKISAAGVVTTLAGSPGQFGTVDGTGSAAQFSRPNNLAADSAGNVYVLDTLAHTVRRVTPDGTVTTVAGSPGQSGTVDGTGSAAEFQFTGLVYRNGIAVDGLGALYVSDAAAQVIRKGLPPYNDLFSWHTPLGGQSIAVTNNNAAASKEPGEPNHNGNVGGKSLWWTWGASTNGPVTVDTIGTTFDTVLAVYTDNSPTNPSVSSLTPVASDGNSGGNHASLLTFQPVPGTVYQIAVDGYNGATGTIALHLNQTSGAAQFVAQPQGLTVLAGSNVVFSASASGSLPLVFQWFKDGVALGGLSNGTNGTSATYMVTNAQVSDSGSYAVVVSNSFGSITSAPALLSVLPRPSNDDYANSIALSGASVSASGTNTQATADGFEPFAFGGHSVWWTWTAPTNGTVTIDTIGSSFDTILGVFTNASPTPVLVASDDQSGGNNASLRTFDVLPNQTFLLAVDGSTLAAPGQGTGTIVLNIHLVSNPPQITLQPQSQNTLTGSNVTFIVTAIGTAPLMYQWQKNGTNIVGATTTALTLANVQPSDSGNYSVHVTNPVGATNSASAALNVVTPPPNDLFANAVIIPNSNLTNTVFGENVGASGEPGELNPAGNVVLETVWWKWTAPTNGTVILDTTGTAFPDVLAVYSGSSVSSLTLIGTGSAGASPAKVVFTATAGVAYYFAVDGLNPPGSGTSAPPNAGNITLNVQESIRIAPQIITQPVSQTVLAGSSVVFTVAASGVPTPTYQWQLNGAPLTGKTGTTLSLSNVSTNQAGAYAVLISNIVGTVLSAQAVLRVDSAVKMSFRANWPDFETGGAEDVQIADGFAYLATDAGLIIVDVSTDPTAPRQVGTYNTDSPGIRVAVTNGFAYLLTASNALSGAVLSRFDVRNPALPRKVAAYLASAANDFALAGSSICLVDGQKLLVLNTNCGLLGSLTTANGVAQAVAAAQPYAYVAWPGFIAKYDISNPASPTPVQLDNQASGQLALSGQYLYSVSSSAGAVALQVLDVTDAVRPAVGNNVINTLGDAQFQGLAVNDAAAYVVTAGSTANALAVYNRNLPPGLAGRILFSDGTPKRLCVDGTLAYVAAGGAGLKIFDVSDPANPVSTGQFLTAVQANQVVLQGNLAYVLDSDPGFHVLDVSDPNNPALLGSYESAHAPGGIAVQGRYVYLALNAPPTGIRVSGASMDIVDVAFPNAPTRVGSTNLPPLAQGTNLLSTRVTAFAVEGNLAVVASCLGTNASLAVVDVSNPARPQVSGRFDLPGTSQIAGLVLQGTYALVADATFGLRVIDFSNPGKAAQVASFPEPPTTYALMLQNGLCFLTGSYGTDVLTDNPPASPTRIGTMSRAGTLTTLPAPFALESGSDGLTVWDLSNPTQWTALGEFAGVSGPVAVQGRYAFVAGGSNGFAALDLGSTFATPPTIIAQPISLRVLPYSTTNFFVAASGTVPLTYQWSYNGASVSDGTHIGGSQSETLSLTDIQVGDAGQYSVLVGNALGSVTSAVATLSVDQLPSVSLTNPVDQEVFSPGVDIALGAQAFDPDGTMTQVAFYNGGTLLGVVASPPYGLTWRSVPAGIYHLSAVATDNEGATNVSSLVTIVVTNLPVIQLSQAIYSVHESNGLATVTLFRNTNGPARVDYFTTDGTARAASGGQIGSYYAVSNSLTFTPNSLSSNVTIQLVNSLVYRGNRSFQIQLCNPASGWTLASPSNAIVTIIDDNPTSTTNSFTDVVFPAAPILNPGSLTILLQPSQANGQWRFAWETAWRPSGSTATNLVPGNYTLVFNDRSGWETPDADVWVVSPGTAETNTYYYVSNGVAASGSLRVDILPPGLSAQWRPVANPTNSWLNTGAELTGIPVGFIEIEFSDVSGYATPASRLVQITPGATEIQATYFLAQAASGRTPQPLPNLAAITNPSAPYQFQGQLLTDVGYSSGFVVKDRTVLTAAHALFDPVLLSFTTNTVWWFFQREAGEYDPVPQSPRGWYVFQGYAASRTTDITNAQNSGAGADDSSAATRQLDAAALYFFEAAGRGGYGGYLTTVPGGTDWFLSGPLMLLLGYPVETVPLSDRGRLHQVGPGFCSFQNTPGTSLYFTSDFQSYPGNSGGPLCVWATNSSGAPFFLPAGIYLGGSGETIVRSIDLDVVDLITRADVSSHGGANNTGGGVITVSAGTVYGDTKSHLVVNLGPADALSKGGSFSLTFSGGYVETFSTAYSQLHFPDTLCPNCGNPSSVTISFGAVSGYDEPANTNVSLVVGQTKVITAAYVPSPRLLVTPATGLSSSGYAGGFFTPASMAYTVSNIGSNALPWAATKTAPWLSLSQGGGTLAAGAGTGITLSLNDRANALSPGTYTDTIGFTNLTNGLGNVAFAVTLMVSVHPPVLFSNAQLFPDGSFALTLQGVAGRVYSIVTSTNLTLPLTNWIELSNGSLAFRLTNTAGLTRFTNSPPPSAPQLYYRAKELQLTP